MRKDFYKIGAPAWSDKADHQIGYNLKEEDLWYDTYISEPIAARLINEKLMEFEICGIPAISNNINLGDIVVVDKSYNILKVVKNGGMIGFRINAKNKKYCKELFEHLEIKYDVEYYNGLFFGVSCRQSKAQELANILQEYENKKLIEYDTIIK